jgi:hypothetical protein
MAWCEINSIRNITGISEDDYSDGQIQEFICLAQKEINSKVMIPVIRERVSYVDYVRKNNIDGLNTTFYLQHWKGNFIGDGDYDETVDVSDIKVYQIDSNNVETILTPASIDYSKCSFTLSTAPQNVTLEVDYTYTAFNPVLPNPLLAQATLYLAASYLDLTDGSSGGSESVRIGSISISESNSGSALEGNKFYQKYMSILSQLTENSTGGAIWGESFVRI